MTFVTTNDPTQRTAKQYKKRKKIATPTPTPTTQQQQQKQTTDGTELDQAQEDYKSNLNSQYPEQ